jgi:hypothetical protein
MKRLVLLVVSVCLTGLAFAQQKPWRDKEMEVKILFHQPADAGRFAELRLNSDISPTFALAYVIPSELKQVQQAGFDYKVTKPNLNEWSASFGAALVPPGYYTFSKIKSIADSLATNFPSICKKVVFGYNAQLQELAALKISDNVDVDENEPEIMFDGGIHGDEVGGPQNVIQFARDLCLAYGTDPQITSLVDSREIWLYYCVNPWGRDNMTRTNSAGIDVNRDNGYMWGGEGGSPGPFSQLESRALRNCQYQNQFVAYTNYHSGTETISYPWSYRYSPAPDKPSIDYLAQVYSNSSGYPTLPYGQGSVIMYLIQGSTKDFNYGSLGSVAWSIEISLDKQTPNVQYYYNINKPAMLALIENVGYGVQGMITDEITGKPIAAAIYVGANYPVYSDGEVGDYHKYLMPGVYDLTFEANGYETKTIPAVPVNDLQCTTVDVQLKPIASQYAYRVITTHIPAFNAQNPGDEAYTAACLGAPDNVNYSIGKGGYIIFDMKDTIFDGDSGTFDLRVYEGDATPEGYTLYSGETMDGPWINLGYATGTAAFDLQPYGVTKARYFMILDDNNGTSNVNDAGFDFDAIASLHPAIPDTVGHLTGYAYDAFTHAPLDSVEVSCGFMQAVTDSVGRYSMELLRGHDEICASLAGFRTECDSLVVLPAQPYSLDFYLFSTVGLQTAESPGSKVKVSPNPFSGSFKIEWVMKHPGMCKIGLFDVEGKKIGETGEKYFSKGSQQMESSRISGAANELKPGSYMLVIQTPDGILQSKIVKAL